MNTTATKVLSYKFDDDIKLFILGDTHIGSPSCNEKLVDDYIDIIAKTPNCYCIIVGDIFDMGLVGSKSDVYTQTQRPGEAIKKGVERLRRIPAEKILVYIDGNHERRLSLMAGINIGAMVCEMLGIPERYSQTASVIRVKVVKKTYYIYATHGSGSGSTYGAAINRLESLASICDADIYVMGHTHKPSVFRRDFIRINTKTGCRERVGKLFLNCGSCLDYEGSYGEALGLKPCSQYYPAIKIKKDHGPVVAF